MPLAYTLDPKYAAVGHRKEKERKEGRDECEFERLFLLCQPLLLGQLYNPILHALTRCGLREGIQGLYQGTVLRRQ